MMGYEEQVAMELRLWARNLAKKEGVLESTSKAFSNKINNVLPKKVHAALTSAIKGIVQASLVGAKYTPKRPVAYGITLEERDRQAEQLTNVYKKVAAAEGAGTGAGGLLLGAVDFPALIAIKMKYLFEMAHIYGFDTSDMNERLYILSIFQLAFSSREHRLTVFERMKNWEHRHHESSGRFNNSDEIDWQKLQQEYRDSLDLRKLLQLVPGIGAVIGAWANYGLLEDLNVAAKNSYRMRILQRHNGLSSAEL